ncbi:MAG: serine/threonine-protein kinase [Lentisphaerota bacterium]
MIKEVIHEGENSYVYRGERTIDSMPVIIKAPSPQGITTAQNVRIQHEYNLLTSLNLSRIIKVYELIKYQSGFALIEEDYSGYSLLKILNAKSLEIESFFQIAIQLAESISQTHENKIIHKDINPSNILWNSKTGKLKLIDFGLSTCQTSTQIDPIQFSKIEGTLAYISPEQTGRMNRAIDYRTDLYSLGATLYQLLIGHPPFTTKNVLELVHNLLTIEPQPPHILDPGIPVILSKLIVKLLAKNAEDRYQSAYGVEADLRKIQHAIKDKVQVTSDFKLAEKDATGRLQIPQKLYGRDTEIKKLEEILKQVLHGSKELAFIAGYSGVGKTSLVGEVQKLGIHSRYFFIEGKFDQYERNLPYSAFSQAFNHSAVRVH